MKHTITASLSLSIFIICLEIINGLTMVIMYGADYTYRPIMGYPLFTFICFYCLLVSYSLKRPTLHNQKSYSLDICEEIQKACIKLYIPISDNALYKQKDYWTFGTEHGNESYFKGDCDDFCLRFLWVLYGTRINAMFNLLLGNVSLMLVKVNSIERNNKKNPDNKINPYHLTVRIKTYHFTYSKEQRKENVVRYFDNLQGNNGLSHSSPRQPYTFIKAYSPYEILEKMIHQRLTRLKRKIKGA